MRSTTLIAVLAAAVLAGKAGAQSFDQSVKDATNADGLILTQIPAQKKMSTDGVVLAQFDAAREGGDHRGPGGGEHRGPGREPGREPGRGHEPGREPGRGHEDHRGHEHQDWGRWQGHPGWGHHYDRWEWDGFGHPHWWGWAIYVGASRAACYEHYGDQLNSCNGSCQIENNECVASCGPWGGDCVAQCNVNFSYCSSECRADYNIRTSRCPW
jgi:hypothetical protein